jgi:ribosomal protein S18 acetylase RimI-like enzyme
MPGKVRIRAAGESDAGALARLAEETFRTAFAATNSAANVQRHCETSYGEALQLAEIRAPDMETWLAEDDGRLVAYAQLRRGTAPAPVGALRPIEIQRFYVHADAHGHGVAHSLMEHVLARAVQLGAEVAWLGVWERNPRAIAFYRKQGFEAVGEQVFVVGDDPQRDLVMRRVVGAVLNADEVSKDFPQPGYRFPGGRCGEFER